MVGAKQTEKFHVLEDEKGNINDLEAKTGGSRPSSCWCPRNYVK